MDPTVRQWRFKEGDHVRSADDQGLGKVVAFWPDMVEPTHLVVEKGVLFRHDYYVPISAVDTYMDDTISLKVTKDEAHARGWEARPTAISTSGAMPMDAAP